MARMRGLLKGGTSRPECALLTEPERLALETDLLKRTQRGEANAFGQLYELYAPSLYSRVLLPKLGDKTAAEDALSETFRTALERLDQFQPQGKSVYFWLARIASNKAMDMHRSRGVSGRALANLELQIPQLLDAPLTPGELLEGRAEYAEFRQRLGQCLEALNPRYRRAIELRFFEERGREQCAELLELKVGTFDVLLLRAVKSLRKQWVEAASRQEHSDG